MTKGKRARRGRNWISRSAGAAVAAALIVAFASVSFAPCPPSVRLDVAPAASDHDCHASPSAAYLTAPCACGCDASLPISGSSPRLGVALLTDAPRIAQPLAARRAVSAAPLFAADFRAPIDHIPLAA